jgi:hypothetical protein
MVVFQDVDNEEVEVGPFDQVCFEQEVVGPSVRSVVRDVWTRDAIAWGYAGFWYRDDRPYKQAFVRAHEES